MRIDGASTLGFAKFDLKTAAEHLSGLGFKSVELSYMGWHSKHFPYKQADPVTVLQMLSKYGVTPISMNLYTHRTVDGRVDHHDYTNSSDAQEAVDQARWYLESAKAMDIEVVTLTTARRTFGDQWDSVMKAFCAVFRRIAKIAADLDMNVNLEVPHLFLIADTVEHVKTVFDEIDSPNVGATVDSSHWGIIGYDPYEFFSWLGPRLKHVHLRDSKGPDSKDGKQNLELTAGKGTADFVLFRKALEHVGYTGRVTLDFEYKIDDLAIIQAEYRQGLLHLETCGWVLG